MQIITAPAAFRRRIARDDKVVGLQGRPPVHMVPLYDASPLGCAYLFLYKNKYEGTMAWLRKEGLR
jgi:hypothetical protein